jgi:hypothetical protein
LNEKQSEESKNDNDQEGPFLVVNLKENVEIVVQSGINRKRVNQKRIKMAVRRFIRCDNAGENMTMKNDPEVKSFGVKFEFSGHRTPQRNRKVERKFQTNYGRI